jgi:hypothetical protein
MTVIPFRRVPCSECEAPSKIVPTCQCGLRLRHISDYEGSECPLRKTSMNPGEHFPYYVESVNTGSVNKGEQS